MRTRSKSSVGKLQQYVARTVQVTNTACSGEISSGPVAMQSANYLLSFTQEGMMDSLGKGVSHDCRHRRFRQEVTIPEGPSVWPILMPGCVIPKGVSSNGDGGQNACASALSMAGLFNTWNVLDQVNNVPPYWTEDLSAINEDAMKNDVLEKANQLKADVLLNIVESNQIVPSVKSLTSSLQEMGGQWKSIRKHIKTASGAFLAYKFGIGPILSDIMTIHRYLPKIKADMKRHSDGKITRFSRVALPRITIVDSPYPSYYDVGGSNCLQMPFQGRALESPNVRYVIAVKPTVAYETSLFKTLDFAMSRFATSPASLAWEKIPFSFVLDWLFDVRGALRAIDDTVRQPPYQLVSFTRSHSYALATDCFLDVLSPCGGTIASFRGSFEYKHYDRSVVTPGGIMPSWSPRFGKNQANISAALIAQAMLKRR